MIAKPGGGRLALMRVLSDAERAAWGGDGRRARRLMSLAARLTSGAQKGQLLAAAESVRSGLNAGAAGLHSEIRNTSGLPRIRPVVDPARPPHTPDVSSVPQAATQPSVITSSMRPRRFRPLMLGLALVVISLGAATSSGARVLLAEGALRMHAPSIAVGVLHWADDGRALIVRGDARLLAGDSVGAAADFVAAAITAGPPGVPAFEAGLRLDRLGERDAAADAMLRAYAAGAARGQWPQIADVLARADRSEAADRVRRGVGR